MRRFALVLAAAAAAAASPAAAGPSITLNGVNIDGIKDQRFENATVVIDAKGDVHVTAKGYAVETEPGRPAAPSAASAATGPAAAPQALLVAPALPASPAPAAAAIAPAAVAAVRAAPPPAPPKLARRYFLASDPSRPDATQYDVAVFINSQWIRELKSAEPQVVMEVTKYLRPGPNKVVLAARKHATPDRRPGDPSATLRVVLGAGDVGGGNVMIDDPLLEMTRTAAETDDRTEEFVVEAR